MSVFLRRAFARTHFRVVHQAKWTPVIISFRQYASRNKSKAAQPEEYARAKGSHATSTSSFIPASQRALSDDSAQAEYDKASAKMLAAVDWLKKEVAGLKARSTGHVTPAILEPVRVTLADSQKELRLEDIATVGVREGTTLVVTVYEDENLKYAEKAIYGAKIPNVVPQKVDPRTLKIVIPRPTMEARAAFFNTASRTAEDTRIQIRKTRDATVRKHKWKPRSEEVEQFQKLCDMRVKQVDQIVAEAKQAFGIQ